MAKSPIYDTEGKAIGSVVQAGKRRLAMNTWNTFTTITTTNATVGSSTTQILASNSNRIYAIIVNDSDETIYLALSDSAEMNKGIRLGANGGTFEINNNKHFTGAINAICTSGSKNVTITEGE